MRKLPLIVLMMYLFILPVRAYDLPDVHQTGSISIALRYAGKPVSGGEVTLYRVGDIREDNGNYSFALTAQFSDSGVSLASAESAETAKKLSEYALRWRIEGVSGPISDEGTLKFGNLRPGLYLLQQQKAAPGYQKLSPFLVSLPMAEPGGYSYHVDASPKASPIPGRPEQTEQPKTGQSLWPVWLFLGSAAGLKILLLYRKRDSC